MKKWAAVLLIFSAIAVVGRYFYFAYERNLDPTASSSAARTIKIAQFGDFFLYAPLYIAIDAGFFAEENIQVELINTGGDDKTWAAVMSKDASFGVADPTFVAIADARGQPGHVIASIVNGVPFWGVTFDTEVPNISSGSQLAGYTVATFPAPSTAYTLQKDMFLDAGLEPKIREGAFGALLVMLEADQADIALELEPNVSQAVEKGAKVVYSLGQVYGDFAITGLTVRPDLKIEDPELIQRVVCALEKSLSYIRKEPDGALVHLQKRFPEVSKTVAADALRRVIDDDIIPESTQLAQDAWNKAISVRQEVGDINTPKAFSYYVDNTFAEKAIASGNCGHK